MCAQWSVIRWVAEVVLLSYYSTVATVHVFCQASFPLSPRSSPRLIVCAFVVVVVVVVGALVMLPVALLRLPTFLSSSRSVLLGTKTEHARTTTLNANDECYTSYVVELYVDHRIAPGPLDGI